jgi:aminoglycoside phosphotransferase (APT) family kinase protein
VISSLTRSIEPVKLHSALGIAAGSHSPANHANRRTTSCGSLGIAAARTLHVLGRYRAVGSLGVASTVVERWSDTGEVTMPSEPLADYEVLPLPSLSDAELRAIVQRHGLDVDGPIERLGSSGVVHSLWSLGTRFVLRVPKDEAMCLGDHRCESVAIPLAHRAGTRTPNLVVFDDSHSIIDVPYSVVSRVHGSDLSAEPFDHSAYVELATLHSADLTAHDHPWFRDPTDLPAEAHLERVIRAGLLHEEGIRWFAALCERLDSWIANAASVPRVFVHGDVKPDNVMVDHAGSVHLIDWGDAGFGDPAYDFQSLPMRSIELALRGYRSVRTDDPTLEARVVRRVVARSLANLCRTPLSGPSWYRPIAANLTDLLTFATDSQVTWNRWTGGNATAAPQK